MIYKKKVERIQNFKNTERSFDPDSSPTAWKHYIVIYSKILKQYSDNYKLNRIKVWLRMGKNSKEVTMGADTDFTFNSEKQKGNAPYYVFKKIVDNDEEITNKKKETILNLLDECSKQHHSLVNFSIMPQTGGMNNFKSNYRFDRFINDLNCFYTGVADLGLSDAGEIGRHPNIKVPSYLKRNTCNKQMLIKYLLKFENINCYCSNHYQIDSKFVEKLICFYNKVEETNKHRALKTASQVEEYCNLAKEYWDIREEKFKEIYSENNEHDIKINI
ncbi:hypothetical protein RZE82_06655 [Mollicutes bacterium LVI A0039]|nr:hypothetical protein RZE82_06655 [Mollicutes bacterium LVI A0039]